MKKKYNNKTQGENRESDKKLCVQSKKSKEPERFYERK